MVAVLLHSTGYRFKSCIRDFGQVMELVDMTALEAVVARRKGSSPFLLIYAIVAQSVERLSEE